MTTPTPAHTPGPVRWRVYAYDSVTGEPRLIISCLALNADDAYGQAQQLQGFAMTIVGAWLWDAVEVEDDGDDLIQRWARQRYGDDF